MRRSFCTRRDIWPLVQTFIFVKEGLLPWDKPSEMAACLGEYCLLSQLAFLCHFFKARCSQDDEHSLVEDSNNISLRKSIIYFLWLKYLSSYIRKLSKYSNIEHFVLIKRNALVQPEWSRSRFFICGNRRWAQNSEKILLHFYSFLTSALP